MKIRSLVYTRNQVKYLDSLPKFGIIAYREREQNWYQGLPKRVHRPVHLLDRTIGIQPPTPTFGNIIADGKKYLINAWWIATMPGVFLFLTLFSINLIGASLERARNRLYRGIV